MPARFIDRKPRRAVSLFSALAILLLAVAPASRAEEKVPPEVAARRSGKVTQATLSRPNMIYTPITPCRAFGGQAIATNQTKVFLVAGSSNLTAQGGPAGGCGIPAYAKAVAINLSSGTSTAQGYLTAYAAGAPRPNQASLSYRAYPATTGSIVQLGSGGRVSVYASAATRVTGDIAGYYEQQLWAYINIDGTVIDSSGRVTATSNPATGSYKVTFDRDITTCAAVASSDFQPWMVAALTSGDTANVYISDGSSKYINYYFNLVVTC